jgi:hypothetical protein
MENSFTDATTMPIGIDINPKEQLVTPRSSLDIELSDKDFIKSATEMVQSSKTFYESKYDLTARRTRNESYLWGRQLRERKMKSFEGQFNDNIIYEALAYLKPIALSRLPDITIAPGPNPNDEKLAEDLTKVVDNDIKDDQRRKVLAQAFKHLPVYYVGVIKPFWNPEIGESGDWDFKVVHPENIVFDHTSSTNNPADMNFVNEYVEYSVKELVMRFPQKEQELYQELRKTGIFVGNKNEKTENGMNSKVKISEIHFKNYEKKGDGYEAVECVGWYYGTLVLSKMKTPNFDWEGVVKVITPEGMSTEEYLRQSILMGQEPQTEKIYNNYFDYPRKPYILINYDQWGKMPLDETSIIEQAIPVQEEHDKRGRQLSLMLDRSRGKNVFSSESGLKKEDIEDLDMADPNTDLMVEGAVNTSFAHIQGDQPGAQIFQDLANTENRIFGKMGVNGAVRGQPTSDTATTNQIARESDFTRADDLTEETINRAAREMAEWILQFIKLRYTEQHYRRVLGADGTQTYIALSRDMVNDGMEVTISASGVDKLKAKQQAMDMAKLQMIDPLTFFKDLGVADPKGRAEKLLMFTQDPAGYMAKYVMGMNNARDLANGLANTQGGADVQPSINEAVGPTTDNPQPENTQQVNIEPPAQTAPMV